MPDPPYQHLSQRTEQGVLILTFTGSLLDAAAVKEALPAVASAGCWKVVLDCRAVYWLVSGSLYPEHEPFKPLLALRRHLEGEGGRNSPAANACRRPSPWRA